MKGINYLDIVETPIWNVVQKSLCLPVVLSNYQMQSLPRNSGRSSISSRSGSCCSGSNSNYSG